MNPDPNPYAPPGLPTQFTWLERLFSWWRQAKPASPLEGFLRGKRWIYCGVVFSLNPKDRSAFRAELPLAVVDEEHVRRNVAEAQRVLGQVLTSWPQLNRILLGRTLVVSHVASYAKGARELDRVSVPAQEWELAVKNAVVESEDGPAEGFKM